MIVYLDSEKRIKAVGESTDNTLTPTYVNENSDMFPFTGWSTAKMCCYQVEVTLDGIITMFTPYIDSKSIDAIDIVGHQVDDITPYTKTKKAYIFDTEVTFTGVPNGKLSVFMMDSEGYFPEFTVVRQYDKVVVSFESLERVADVTISIQ